MDRWISESERARNDLVSALTIIVVGLAFTVATVWGLGYALFQLIDAYR